MAERIQSPRAAEITGLSLRGVQALAAAGRIPGAAMLGKRWTFDEAKLREWIRQEEQAVQDRAKRAKEAASWTPDQGRLGSIDEAYRRAIGLDKKPAARRTAR